MTAGRMKKGTPLAAADESADPGNLHHNSFSPGLYISAMDVIVFDFEGTSVCSNAQSQVRFVLQHVRSWRNTRSRDIYPWEALPRDRRSLLFYMRDDFLPSTQAKIAPHEHKDQDDDQHDQLDRAQINHLLFLSLIVN
jgi:hypothetical protein